MKHLLNLKYVGTDFCGYQVQPGKRTVQSVLQDAIERVYGIRYDVKGCSRTDSGVHANSFYATFETSDSDGILIPDNNIPFALNANLPDDISVLSSISVDTDFHVRHDVVYKEYVYVISDGLIKDPFLKNRSHYYQRTISDSDIARMNEAAKHICGKHDFRAFMSSGSDIIDTVRDVKYLNVSRENDTVKIYIAADGFLYNMVRIIAGTLLDVARGKTEPSQLAAIIDSLDRTNAGPTLPPHGLYLNKVIFNFKKDN